MVETVATLVLLLIHCTSSVVVLGFTFFINCTVCPISNVELVGLTDKLVIEVITTTVQLALFPFAVVAVILVVPFPTAVTFPFPSTVAIPVLSLFHVISLFTFAVDGVIVACNVSDTFVLKSNARLSFIDIPFGLVCTVTVTD